MAETKQHNGRNKKVKRTNDDLQNITQTATDWATQTLLNNEGECRSSGRVNSSAILMALVVRFWYGYSNKNVQTCN
jgi:hypothetical protein